MFLWVPYSFLRIVIFYIAGILGAIYLPGYLPIEFVKLCVVIGSILFTVIAYLRFRGKKLVNPGPLGLLLVTLAGYWQLNNADERQHTDHILRVTDSISFYKVILTEELHEKTNSWKAVGNVEAIRIHNSWQQKSGKVLLYFSKKDFPVPFQYGDALLIKGRPQELEGPANPGEFDYKRFLTFRRTYHQHFLRRADVVKTGNEPPNVFMQYAIKARQWSKAALNRNIHGEREQAIASALVLGVTDGLDNELLGAYAATGAMHVLAVSGLHVGIIYVIIMFFFNPVQQSALGKWTAAISCLFLLWSYAFITGLTPSVLRAVTMFSFLVVARPLGWQTNIYNTLAASAFCLLLWDPYLIMSVGFQLSYLAVISIVFLQPRLYHLWETDNWLLDKTWQITCVSLAAQAGTFSLGLLYFHQFPVYFLFSNLFVIPGSFLVLVLGLALITVSSFQWIATAIGFVLEWTIKGLNFGVFAVESLPFSLIENVYISTFQCWLVMVGILAIFLLMNYRKFVFAVLAATCFLVFVVLQWSNFFDLTNHQELVVYKVSGHTVFDIRDKSKVFFFSDSTFSDQERIRFHIRPYRLQRGVHRIADGYSQKFVKEFKGCRLIQWRSTSILIIYNSDYQLPPNVNPQYVVLGKNARIKMNAQLLNCKKLILDSSNSGYFAKQFNEKLMTAGVKVHSVQHHGAFLTKL